MASIVMGKSIRDSFTHGSTCTGEDFVICYNEAMTVSATIDAEDDSLMLAYGPGEWQDSQNYELTCSGCDVFMAFHGDYPNVEWL